MFGKTFSQIFIKKFIGIKQGFKVAYIIFKDPKSLKKAMTIELKTNTLSSNEKPIKTGIESKQQ